MRERDIFIEALEQGNPSERAALLDEACQADAELRGRVERLLAEHERQESFILDTPPAGLDATVDPPARSLPARIVLRVRHPEGKLIKSVTVDGQPHESFDPHAETVTLTPGRTTQRIRVQY